MNYRADLDGLRAIAVAGVLIYHFGIHQLPGGFTGVDVFFVLSGFLITSILVGEFDRLSDISFRRFYQRRFMRLFPAAAFTVLLSVIFGYFLFQQELFERLGGSSIYSLLSLSNFYFYFESGYFDESSILKPLLHTWSLAVEEQFYVIWPAIILATLRVFSTKHIFTTALVLSVLSFVAGEYLLGSGGDWGINAESMVFFMMPFRIFEFGLGAMMSALMLTNWFSKLPRTVAEPAGIIGIAIILFSFLFIHEEMRFPSYTALIPSVGTILVIAFARPDTYVFRFLTLQPLVWVGKLSYSLYLIHWPVVVFFSYRFPGTETLTFFVVCVAITVILSIICHYLIERPFRYGFPRLSLAPVGGSALVIAVFGIIIIGLHIYNGDVEPAQPEIISNSVVNRAMRERGLERPGRCALGRHDRVLRRDGVIICNNEAPLQILTIGNSHEQYIYDAVRLYLQDDVSNQQVNVVFGRGHSQDEGTRDTRTSCQFSRHAVLPFRTPHTVCQPLADRLNDVERIASEFDTIVVATYRADTRHGSIYLDFAQQVQRINPALNVLVFGTAVSIDPYQCYAVVNATRDMNSCSRPALFDYQATGERERIQERFPDLRFNYVNQQGLYCDSISNCSFEYIGLPIIYDAHHFNNLGAFAFQDRLLARPSVEAELRVGLGLPN